MEYCDYENVNEKVSNFFIKGQAGTYEKVFVTDISVEDDLAEIINRLAKDDLWYLLDHHPTALDLNKYDWCNVVIENAGGIKTSGTELFYHWLVFQALLNNSDILQRFSNTVRNYDTWRWAEIGDDGIISKQVNDLLYLYGRDKFIDWCIKQLEDNSFPKLSDDDKSLLDIKQSEIDRYVEEKYKSMIIGTLLGHQCGFVYADKFVSELGNRLCKMNSAIDFVAMINIDAGKIEYRSVKEDIDLGKDIASVFGGGGHPKAAGSELHYNSKEIMLKGIFTPKQQQEIVTIDE